MLTTAGSNTGTLVFLVYFGVAVNAKQQTQSSTEVLFPPTSLDLKPHKLADHMMLLSSARRGDGTLEKHQA